MESFISKRGGRGNPPCTIQVSESRAEGEEKGGGALGIAASVIFAKANRFEGVTLPDILHVSALSKNCIPFDLCAGTRAFIWAAKGSSTQGGRKGARRGERQIDRRAGMEREQRGELGKLKKKDTHRHTQAANVQDVSKRVRKPRIGQDLKLKQRTIGPWRGRDPRWGSGGMRGEWRKGLGWGGETIAQLQPEGFGMPWWRELVCPL